MYADAPSNYPFDRFACMLNIDEVPGDCFAKEFTCTKDDEPPVCVRHGRVIARFAL